MPKQVEPVTGGFSVSLPRADGHGGRPAPAAEGALGAEPRWVPDGREDLRRGDSADADLLGEGGAAGREQRLRSIFELVDPRLPRAELKSQLGDPGEHLPEGWIALARAPQACGREKARGHLLPSAARR